MRICFTDIAAATHQLVAWESRPLFCRATWILLKEKMLLLSQTPWNVTGVSLYPVLCSSCLILVYLTITFLPVETLLKQWCPFCHQAPPVEAVLMTIFALLWDSWCWSKLTQFPWPPLDPKKAGQPGSLERALKLKLASHLTRLKHGNGPQVRGRWSRK